MQLDKQPTTVDLMEYLIPHWALTSTMVGHPLHGDFDSPLCFEEEKQYHPNQLLSIWYFIS
jgi:hypothetical protein